MMRLLKQDRPALALTLGTYVELLGAALLTPWTLHERARDVSSRLATWLAAFHIAIAAGVSTLLSSWTYLAGKGVLLGRHEMDMGQDDLPPDTVAQVALGLVRSVGTWALLLALALGVCVAVADVVYLRDRARFRQAARGAGLASVWLVVWAVAVFALNSKREEGLHHPSSSIRAYAQLNQQGFRGSSAVQSGPPEREPLAGSGRLLPLAVGLSLLWSIGLAFSERTPRPIPRLAVFLRAAFLCGLCWVLLWRAIPWLTIGAWTG
jgi:hypothetical protein